MISDADIVDAAVEAARDTEAGTPPSASHLSLLRAIVATREQTQRQALEREAAARAGSLGLGAIALDFLRLLFLLAI